MLTENSGSSGLSPCATAANKSKFRFHLCCLAHIPTHPDITSCAYSNKNMKLARMLKNLGHTVYAYVSEGSQVECEEMITVGTEAERIACYGVYDWKKEFFKHDPADHCHKNFNARSVGEILLRKEERDFLLISMGNYQKPVADAAGIALTTEAGIGYTGIFAKYKIFESEAWRHYCYGLMHQGDINWYDTCIPNYYDPADFVSSVPKGDYFLYVGRLISRKGLAIAVDVTKRIGTKLIVAGQGDLSNVDGMDLRAPHVQHIGSIGKQERADLMTGAIGLFAPTIYISPFEGVHAESLLCGTPVITTPVGVFSETVIDGFNGFKCHNLDEFMWAAKLAPSLPTEPIRKYAISKFSMEVVAKQYQTYFEQLQDLYSDGWNQLHAAPPQRFLSQP